jgi:type I restriction enzyme S subunit
VRLKSLLSIPLRNGLSPSNSGLVSAKILTLSAITSAEFDSTLGKSVNVCDFLICRGNGNVHLVGKGYFPTCSMIDVTFPDTMIAARTNPEYIERE